MASSDILSQTLNSITSTKLEQVSKQRISFEEGKLALLAKVEDQKTQLQRVRVLLDGIEKLPFIEKSDPGFKINLRNFLHQAEYDPSVSPSLLKEWEQKLTDKLNTQSVRLEYASLYGKLVEDWVENGTTQKKSTVPTELSDGESFEKVGRKEMHEQRKTWEDYVFTPLETDTTAIETYLDGLFRSEQHIKKAHDSIKESTADFERSIRNWPCFDEDSLKLTIAGLLKSDLLTDANATILRDFSGNKTVLREIADVLNMRLSNLDSWGWDKAGVQVEQRRHLNGRYRFYSREPLLDTIFLRYIGVRWSVYFKQTLKAFATTEGIWKVSSAPVSKEDKERREHFLGAENTYNTPEYRKAEMWKQDIFLEQLQNDIKENTRLYEDKDDDSDVGAEQRKTPQQLVQDVLHTIVTDITIRTRLGEDLTCCRSDFKWFGPSVPHSSMFTTLKYFGVSDQWISFFKRALECPVKFAADGDNAPVRVRRRGTPISGPLSDVLGETVLFVLDFAINTKTNGAPFWRLHDDLWWWGGQETCKVGWKTITDFSKLVGLELSEDKTGSVMIPKNRHELDKSSAPTGYITPPGLPKGAVRWGFLKLESNGRLMIDENMLDEHIKELRTQLDNCKSVFDWIQAWNIYSVRFFTVNFGRPAFCNGRIHVEAIIAAFHRIQNKLFGPSGLSGASVTEKKSIHSVSDYVRHMLGVKFGISDIPEGYLYWPMKRGGLELKNPFVLPYSMRKQLTCKADLYLEETFEKQARPYDADEEMDEFLTNEEIAYNAAKERFDRGEVRHSSTYRDYESSLYRTEKEFMSFKEYTKYRQQTSFELGNVFEKLMSEPADLGVEHTPVLLAGLGRYEWDNMSMYDKWIMQLHSGDMLKKFGSAQVVEKGLLPVGMVSMTRQSRFMWKG